MSKANLLLHISHSKVSRFHRKPISGCAICPHGHRIGHGSLSLSIGPAPNIDWTSHPICVACLLHGWGRNRRRGLRAPRDSNALGTQQNAGAGLSQAAPAKVGVGWTMEGGSPHRRCFGSRPPPHGDIGRAPDICTARTRKAPTVAKLGEELTTAVAGR